ncbi:squalene cyclase [Myceligenerans pegani]|uniref:Squalene cyclase n=1 Tax=Myceligenerans pegani TaxID=2776917 RepID=A0ABR9MVB5_9MICO|nr:squalene cyclase [Myceligenerans sp. TRM 65318]MBE1875330.1 squalene cyclase [Myceligenerans sp. TRM 65318]MBE3017601.1 squalene cyclase [Myceligenerans sp. TRM 65318]
MPAPALTDWLLDSDPALRWQVERDLLHEPPEIWRATRARIATEGFGARLLALQDDDGQWAGGAFFPKDFDVHGPEAAPGAGQPWTATTWSLNSLRGWGLDPAVPRERRTAELIAENSRWEYDGLPYWGGEVDCCINAYTLANGVWLGVDVDGLVDWLVEHRQDDGGWNCEWVNGSVRSSFHSTLNVLGALLDHEEATGGTEASRSARRAGEEYLLERGLFRRLSTGDEVGSWADTYVYPFRWRYSVLRAADHFRRSSGYDGTPPDPRMSDAIALVRAARQPDGTWIQQGRHPGRAWFEEDVPPGEPSPWLTLYGTRVLEWWDAGGPGRAGARRPSR